MKTYWLSTHLDYACRHSGACCSSGWAIPIEHERAAVVRRAVAAGDVTPAAADWLAPPGPHAPAEVAGTLTTPPPAGACVFHRPSGAAGGCAIHAMRPASCEHFPYVCVIDPRGVHVTLSHYCPAAAARLFDDDGPVDVVEGPPVLRDGREPEGLDAREALPPTWSCADGADAEARAADGAEAEAGAADGADTGARAADGADTGARAADGADAGARAADGADATDGAVTFGGDPYPARGRGGRAARAAASLRLRLMDWEDVTRWERHLVRALARDRRVPVPPDLRWFDRARAAVPAPLSWPAPPEDLEAGWTDAVMPAWSGWGHVIGRYLAARAHGSWALHLGKGLTDVEHAVRMARAVLQVEAVRQCRQSPGPFDRARLLAAIRQSDLLLVHYADPYRLWATPD